MHCEDCCFCAVMGSFFDIPAEYTCSAYRYCPSGKYLFPIRVELTDECHCNEGRHLALTAQLSSES